MSNESSIMRIKHFSDSEDAESDTDMPVDNDDKESEEEQTENNELQKNGTSTNKDPAKKTKKKGIIYISSIPKHMNVSICRELMEQFGDVGRIFLQPDKKGSKLF
jgi:ESF2/ABP1 family protein